MSVDGVGVCPGVTLAPRSSPSYVVSWCPMPTAPPWDFKSIPISVQAAKIGASATPFADSLGSIVVTVADMMTHVVQPQPLQPERVLDERKKLIDIGFLLYVPRQQAQGPTETEVPGAAKAHTWFYRDAAGIAFLRSRFGANRVGLASAAALAAAPHAPAPGAPPFHGRTPTRAVAAAAAATAADARSTRASQALAGVKRRTASPLETRRRPVPTRVKCDVDLTRDDVSAGEEAAVRLISSYCMYDRRFRRNAVATRRCG